ncbi:MAG: UvrD-helicase domain-containing protein, partial [Gammaproteobacteria bacterium]
MSRFEARTQPLQDTWLVDASAGTGKTHALTSLVLRFLLGHDGERTGVSPLGIEQLLIVTFTKAATNELRGRIRKRVQQALRRFSGEEPDPPDELIDELFRDSADPAADRERLALAAASMDLAAVHTIHAFANRVLQRHAFESGAPFDAAIHEDASTERAELVLDFWRERVYP